MKLTIASFTLLLLAVAVGACSDDGGPVNKTDQQVTGDIFPSDGPFVPLGDGSADRYVPPNTDGSSKLDGGGTKDSYAPPPATCNGTAKVILQEVSTGQPDYLAVKNTGGSPVNLANFKLVMHGINVETYTFQAGASVAAGQVLYVFEYTYGDPGDVNTGDNIPFYDDLSSNAVALYDASGNLLDFVAIGDKIVGQPPGANVTLLSWPANYDADKQSLQRVAQTGQCPNFKASDWAAKALTKTSSSP